MSLIAKQLTCIRTNLARGVKSKRRCLETNLTRLLSLRQSIRKKNAAFEASSPAEKRVIIAKEVIEQIQLHKLNPDHGSGYLTIKMETAELKNKLRGETLQEVLLTRDDVSCTVCGIGALVVGCSIINGECKVRDETALRHGTRQPFKNHLDDHFSTRQLNLVEAAFEKWGAGHALHGNDKAASFGWRYEDPANRLTAIMQNVINNKGTFKP